MTKYKASCEEKSYINLDKSQLKHQIIKGMVSVVTPVRYVNRKWLKESFLSALSQDYPNLELIVVNDVSTQDIDDLVESFGIYKYIKNERNMGAAYSFNRGFEVSQGEYLYLLAADDYILPGIFTRLVREMEAHPEFSIVYAGQKIIDEEGNTMHIPVEELSVAKLSGNNIDSAEINRSYTFFGGSPGAWLMRREVWEGVGGYDETLPGGIDHDFWVRASRKFKIRRIPFAEKPYFAYRLHPNSITSKGRAFNLRKLRLLLRELELFPDDKNLLRAVDFYSNVVSGERIEEMIKVLEFRNQVKQFEARYGPLKRPFSTMYYEYLRFVGKVISYPLLNYLSSYMKKAWWWH